MCLTVGWLHRGANPGEARGPAGSTLPRGLIEVPQVTQVPPLINASTHKMWDFRAESEKNVSSYGPFLVVVPVLERRARMWPGLEKHLNPNLNGRKNS